MTDGQPAEPDTLADLIRAALRGPAAPTVRAAIAGAVAALATAPLPELNAEPEPAHRASDALAALLDETDTRPDPAASSRQAVLIKPELSEEPGLRELALAFTKDAEVARWIGEGLQLIGVDDRETWWRLWLACLRLPPDVAGRWREAATVLSPPSQSAAEWCELPGTGGVLVAPGFGAPGLRESTTVDLGKLVAARVPQTPEFAALRILAGQVEAMAAYDDTLCYALEERRRTGFLPLSADDNRTYLQRDLAWRIGDLIAAQPGSAQALRELHGVDELLCSVTYVPPVHPQSWWGTLVKRSRAMLTEAASALRESGTEVTVRAVPLGDFASHRELIGPYNVACPAPGRPESEILACLRTWMRLGSELHLGRVVHVRNGG